MCEYAPWLITAQLTGASGVHTAFVQEIARELKEDIDNA